MRSVTREQVLEAADWCARRGQEWRLHDGMASHPEALASAEDLCMDAAIAAREERGWENPLSDDYAFASSILYAAALEGGPMPAGWTIAANARGA